MEHAVRKLPIDRNIASVFALSDDVLTYIFCSMAHPTILSMLDIFAISHTCCHWRTVAISCPELWRRYVFEGPNNEDRSNELLKRCGAGTTLDVGWARLEGYRYHACVPGSLEIDSLLRIRSYELVLSNLVVNHLRTVKGSSSPLAALEHLTIRQPILHVGQPQVPDQIIAGGIPSLKTLTISHCWVNIDLICPDNIRVLRIEANRPKGDPWANSTQWVHLLQRCQRLVVLSLKVGLENPNADFVQEVLESQLILLPELVELNLYILSPSSLCHILNRMTVPALRMINIVSTYGRNSPSPQSRRLEETLKVTIGDHILPKCTLDGCALTVDVAIRFGGRTSTTFAFSPGGDTGNVHRIAFTETNKVGALLPLWLPVAPFLSSLDFVLPRDSLQAKACVDSFIPAATRLRYISSKISLNRETLPSWAGGAPWRQNWGSVGFIQEIHCLSFRSEEPTEGRWHEVGNPPSESIAFTAADGLARSTAKN